MAQALKLDYQTLAKFTAANPAAYRSGLARLVYSSLSKRIDGALLVLDHATDDSYIADFLEGRPLAVAVIITTPDPKFFGDRYPHLLVDKLSSAEASALVCDSLVAMGRPKDDEAAATLVAEVGLVPHQLKLATSLLQSNTLVSVE